MRFFIGLILNDGSRRILTGYAQPSITSLEEIPNPQSAETYSWGTDEDERAVLRTAWMLLANSVGADIATAQYEQYAMAIVQRLSKDKPWLIQRKDIEAWVLNSEVVGVPV